MRIYIAGPIGKSEKNPSRLVNVLAGLRAGAALLKRGHSPYIPHLTHFLDERQITLLPEGERLDYEDYLRVDFDFISVCDGLLFLGSSPGADRELQFAKKLGLKIYYSLDEIPG